MYEIPRCAPKCMNFQEVRDKSYEIPEGMWKNVCRSSRCVWNVWDSTRLPSRKCSQSTPVRLGLTLIIFDHKIVTFRIRTFRGDFFCKFCMRRMLRICVFLKGTRQHVWNSRRYAPKCMKVQKVRAKSYEIPESMRENVCSSNRYV